MKKSIFEKRIVVIVLALTATFLWGSAFPAIKLGYQYMHIDGMDTAAQILFAGTRFTLAGFSSVFIKKYSEYEDPVILSGYQFVCGGLLMVICGLLFGGRITQPTGTGIMLLLWLAMVSAVAYSLWSILLKYNPVTRVAIFGFTNPIFGAFLSALFLGESDFLGVSAIVSLVLVSIGICMVNMTGKEDIQN